MLDLDILKKLYIFNKLLIHYYTLLFNLKIYFMENFNEIDFEKEMSIELLEERLEMVSADGGSCERKCSGGDGGDSGTGNGGSGGNGPTTPIELPAP